MPQIASGGVLDLNGTVTTMTSLSNLNASGGTVNTTAAGAATLVLTPSGGTTTTFGRVIQNSAGQVSLTLSGNGLQLLTGNSTFSGLTTITAGTLQIGNGVAAGSINGSSGIVDNGALAFDNPGTTALPVPVSGSWRPDQRDPGMLVRSASSNYTGVTAITGGTVHSSADRQLPDCQVLSQ